MVAKKKGVTKVVVCEACHSPHLRTLKIGTKQKSICQRCGHAMSKPSRQPLRTAQKIHDQRKLHAKRAYHARKAHAHHSFYSFLSRFHLRMWFKIISTILLGAGLVLMTTTELWTGVLFTLIGVLGLYTGLRL